MLTKEQKHEQSLELRDGLADVTTLFLLENEGLNVNDVNILRSQVRKSDATYKVVKNTVVRLAVEGTEMEGITPFSERARRSSPTPQGDGVALAKVLKTFIKDHPELSFKHAYLEGQILEAEDAVKMADMPSRDELIARLLQMLQSPMRRLAVALNAPLQQFASCDRAACRQGRRKSGSSGSRGSSGSCGSSRAPGSSGSSRSCGSSGASRSPGSSGSCGSSGASRSPGCSEGCGSSGASRSPGCSDSSDS